MVEFQSMPNHWTPLVLSREVGRRPVARVLDGVPVVCFRDAKGGAAVLVDRCPHRGAPLSRGRCSEEGELICPFHAWRFDGAGRCVGTPFDGRARSSKMHAAALPNFEAGGLVWAYTGIAEEVPERPPLPVALVDGRYRGRALYRDWDAHWSRAIQTMLDVSHIPFVHPFTIGFALGRGIGRGEGFELNVDLQPRDGDAFHVEWAIRSEQGAGDAGWLTFLPPNGVIIPIPQSGAREWLLFIFCVPTEAGCSRQFVVPRRNFGARNPLLPLADQLNATVLAEDRPNVEGAEPVEVPPPGEEISVPSDAPTIAFQQYYHRTFR
ncbi:MAG: Rieske 2Fe-2S domain-containing protein [Myxococcota bacterium]